MARPNVRITLGNGSLGRSSVSDDGVAGLVLTGTAVPGKLDLNKHYLLSGTADLSKLGIDADTNPLVYKEIVAFYAQTGEGAELHLLVVSEATTLTQMCDTADSSPLRRLVDAGQGRIRLVGVNKIAPVGYEADTTPGIDKDAITASEKAQAIVEDYAEKVQPFRILMAAPNFQSDCETLFQPRESSTNGIGFVLVSDDAVNHSAAIGLVLGRAALLSVHQSLGRVKSGTIGTNIYLTDGTTYLAAGGWADRLHDAGYIIPIAYPRKNGAYLSGDPMAAPVTDAYSQLRYGRVIDKVRIIAYDTFIDEVLDNVEADSDGTLTSGQCVSYAAMIENAVMTQMADEIESFTCSIVKEQDILSSERIEVSAEIQPKGVVSTFNITLGFVNPAVKNS